jgi:hypothetical protein
MATKLGGWHRLWVVIAFLYLVILMGVAWSTRPEPASIPHQAAFYAHLPPEVQSRILNSQIDPTKERIFIQDAKNTSNAILVEMPNNHILVFRKDLAQSDAEASARAYWDSVESQASNERLGHFFYAAAWWVMPVALVYALGWAIGWVYRGFKSTKGTL